MAASREVTRVVARALAVTLVAAACSGGAGSSRESEASTSSDPAASAAQASTGTAAAPSPQLADLEGIDDLRARFNTGDGDPRLLVLLSPT